MDAKNFLITHLQMKYELFYYIGFYKVQWKPVKKKHREFIELNSTMAFKAIDANKIPTALSTIYFYKILES